MKNQHLLLLAIFAVFFYSCKKSTAGNGPGTTPVKLKYLTQEIIIDSTQLGVTTTIFNYTYDSKKRLISSKSGNDEVDYVYNDDGTVYSTTQIDKLDVPDTYIRVFSYNGDKVSAAVETQYTQNKLINTNNYGFAYSGDKISEVHASGDSDNGITLYYYDSNGNFIKTDENSGSFVTTNIYDNKKSPYINLPQTLKNVAVNPDFCSPSNVISSTNPNGTFTYNYQYDSDGYATAKIIKYGTTQTDKLGYTYTEL